MEPLPHPRRVLPLALPIVAENLLVMAVMWSDMLIAGRLLAKPEYLAAMIAASYLVWFSKGFSELVNAGSAAIVAREIGARNPAAANAIAAQAVGLALLLGAGLAAAVFFGAERLSSLLLADGAGRDRAAEYLRAFAWCMPLTLAEMVGVGILRAAGQTSVGMRIGLLMNLANLALCWPLTYRFGWQGLAWGASLAFMAGGLLTLRALARGAGDMRVPRPQWPRRAEAWRILRLGIPGAAATLGPILCHLAFVAAISKLGPIAVAAHGVAIHVESIGYLIAEALGLAALTLVGQALGAGRPDLARACTRRALLLAIGWMAGVSLLFGGQGRLVFGLFTAEPEIVDVGAGVLRIAAVTEPLLGALIVLIGVFRGAGDARWLLAMNLAGLLLVRIPGTLWLTGPSMGWGLAGAWMAMAADLCLRLGLAAWRFRQGGWANARV